MRNNDADLETQADALAGALDELAGLTGEDRFVLVGFSLGGLIARAHVTRHPRNHHAVELVTLGAPHQGSDWAYLYELFAPVKEECARSGRGLERLLLAPLCELVKGFEERLGVRLDAPILRDLAPPEYGADGRPLNALARLAHAEHPSDLRYVSVVGEVEAPRDVAELERALKGMDRELDNGDLGMTENKARVLALIKGLIGHLLDYPEYLESGDGAVSAASQDLSRLPWFAHRVRGVEDSEWRLGTTVRYHLDDTPNPLRVEYTTAAHLAQTRSPEVLFHAIAGRPSLTLLDPPRTTGAATADIHGQVDDLLFDPHALFVLRDGQAGLAALGATARSAGDGRNFAFTDVPLEPGANTLVVRYSAVHATAGEPIEQSFTVERRTGLVATVLRHPWLSTAVAMLILVAFARAGAVRRRNRAGSGAA
jgi:pimeloyl-ACP methyl ester carboxylesterase